MSNQLSDFHDDIQRLKFLPYSREKKNEYANEWDIFGSFSKLSRNGILRFFFPYSGHIEDTKSVEFASVAICSIFFIK